MDRDISISKLASVGNARSGPISADGSFGKTIKLIDSAPSTAATSDVYTGGWCDTSTLKYANATVDGSFTGTVIIEGTNKDNPQATDAGYSLLSVAAPTAPALVVLTMPVKWVRARVSNFTAGAVTVVAHGVA
jgi:hypothetical protein